MAETAFAYRSRDKSSDSDSDSSDFEREDWKKACERAREIAVEKTPVPPPILPPPKREIVQMFNKRKRNNIWCDVLEDQMISETLNHCGIKNKPKGYGSRGCESYDYTNKYLKKDYDSDNKMSADEMSDSTDTHSVTSFKSKKFQNSKKFVKLDDAGAKAARKIVRTLGEQKPYLIFRVVKHIGIAKAMQLLKETEEIEESGGMMVKNQQRRRTPGGVYFQLLKSDKDVTKAAVDQIFEGERNSFEMKKLADERRKKKKLQAEKKKLLQQLEGLKDEPNQSETQGDCNLEVMEEEVMEEPIVPSKTQGSDLEDGEIDD